MARQQTAISYSVIVQQPIRLRRIEENKNLLSDLQEKKESKILLHLDEY